ncbi:hypothetical protein LTR95_004014 [Oleoguttula sp. CCFEE 5521]
MEAFLTRKRKAADEPLAVDKAPLDDDDDTDTKLAILGSLYPAYDQGVLLDYLLAYEGSVDKVLSALDPSTTLSPRKKSAATGYQSSLASFRSEDKATAGSSKRLAKKGQTLHLYSPQDVENQTPCSIIHNFLPAAQADALLTELLQDVQYFRRDEFQMFERTVTSPHTMGFYVDTMLEVQEQKDYYSYNGTYFNDVRQTKPEMLSVSRIVSAAVNKEIERRTRDFNPGGGKLKFQSTEEWRPNTSFVNCYDGGKESVGYHTDEPTYMGPRAVIGSLSLGVAREFRVRKIVPPDSPSSADEQGQIAIHLPHNSLLVMHADMQEEWKHSIAPAQTIDPHPIAGNKRLNITYRCFKDYLNPRLTIRCKCNVPGILRCVQKARGNRGRYVWMCNRGYAPGQKSCGFFEWAKFDEDGRPPWAEGYKGNENLPVEVAKDDG